MKPSAELRRGAVSRRIARLGALVLFLCWAAAPLAADEFSQVSSQATRLLAGTVVVDARVGDIRVEGWDRARVEVEATKVVRAGSRAKAEHLFPRIRVRLTTDEEGRTVTLKTLYPPRRPWRPFRGESKLTVNLHVMIPSNAKLRLECVDGDVTVRGVRGDVQLKVNYGDVEIDVPSVFDLRSLRANTWLGYVQSDLKPLGEDAAGFGRGVSYWNASGDQNINVHVRMGGIFVYRGAE
jgi:hypothetical protein